MLLELEIEGGAIGKEPLVLEKLAEMIWNIIWNPTSQNKKSITCLMGITWYNSVMVKMTRYNILKVKMKQVNNGYNMV